MKTHTGHLTFGTRRRRELVRITDQVRAFQEESGISEGLVDSRSSTPSSTGGARSGWSRRRWGRGAAAGAQGEVTAM
jgi:hypothetical protein